MAITYNLGTQNRCNMRKRDTPKLGNIPCFPTLRALPAYLIGFLPSFGLYIGSTLRALIMDTTITSSFREGHEEAQGRRVRVASNWRARRECAVHVMGMLYNPKNTFKQPDDKVKNLGRAPVQPQPCTKEARLRTM
ncbi:hypothetical protein AXG93_4080s1000 [Marchantia polymorpha subsp. ruderalis]|uniref:Uncharacterized protein n=1 Tax=Marchantia polymorpha subsp. ruderalis TaxID=1480154 RepID=A0A176VUZ1_MARPO|nr:hypothetical protein AXG93_4080s1000 [Marchantia polymorpha subsp. ruderalis]